MDTNPYAPPPVAPSDESLDAHHRPRTVGAQDAADLRRMAKTLRFVGIAWCVIVPLSLVSALANGFDLAAPSTLWIVLGLLVSFVPIVFEAVFLVKAGHALRRSVRKGHANGRPLKRALVALRIVFIFSVVAGIASALTTYGPGLFASVNRATRPSYSASEGNR